MAKHKTSRKSRSLKSSKSIANLSKKQLNRLAKSCGVSGYSTIKKSSLVTKLRKSGIKQKRPHNVCKSSKSRSRKSRSSKARKSRSRKSRKARKSRRSRKSSCKFGRKSVGLKGCKKKPGPKRKYRKSRK